MFDTSFRVTRIRTSLINKCQSLYQVKKLRHGTNYRATECILVNLVWEKFPIYNLFLVNIYGSEKIQKRNIPLSFSSLIFLADDYQSWQQVKGH